MRITIACRWWKRNGWKHFGARRNRRLLNGMLRILPRCWHLKLSKSLPSLNITRELRRSSRTRLLGRASSRNSSTPQLEMFYSRFCPAITHCALALWPASPLIPWERHSSSQAARIMFVKWQITRRLGTRAPRTSACLRNCMRWWSCSGTSYVAECQLRKGANGFSSPGVETLSVPIVYRRSSKPHSSPLPSSTQLTTQRYARCNLHW